MNKGICAGNKRGAVLLLATSIAFLIAVVIFFSYSESGGKVSVGAVEEEIFSLYSEAHEALDFIDFAAQHSALRTDWQEEPAERSIEHFKSAFENHIESFNKVFSQKLSIDDYSFEIEGCELKGIASKDIIFKSAHAEYSVAPNFHIRICE